MSHKYDAVEDATEEEVDGSEDEDGEEEDEEQADQQDEVSVKDRVRSQTCNKLLHMFIRGATRCELRMFRIVHDAWRLLFAILFVS